MNVCIGLCICCFSWQGLSLKKEMLVSVTVLFFKKKLMNKGKDLIQWRTKGDTTVKSYLW